MVTGIVFINEDYIAADTNGGLVFCVIRNENNETLLYLDEFCVTVKQTELHGVDGISKEQCNNVE